MDGTYTRSEGLKFKSPSFWIDRYGIGALHGFVGHFAVSIVGYTCE